MRRNWRYSVSMCHGHKGSEDQRICLLCNASLAWHTVICRVSKKLRIEKLMIGGLGRQEELRRVFHLLMFCCLQ